MESVLDVQVLLICAFLGFCLRAIFGLSPLMLLGTVSLISLVLPAFLITLSGNAELTHILDNRVNLYVATLTNMLPSMITGELAGIFTKDILRLPKAIIDHIRALL